MTNINDLAAEINRQLRLYALQVRNDTAEIAEKIATQGEEELKQTSPKRNGNYAEGWTVTKRGKVFVVHNKEHYRLTHLLEKGHAKVNGGRTRKFPHIKKVELKLIADFEDELRRVLG